MDSEQVSYDDVCCVARDLLAAPDENVEYARGIVELIADCFSISGMELADRKLEVSLDIWPAHVPRSGTHS